MGVNGRQFLAEEATSLPPCCRLAAAAAAAARGNEHHSTTFRAAGRLLPARYGQPGGSMVQMTVIASVITNTYLRERAPVTH